MAEGHVLESRAYFKPEDERLGELQRAGDLLRDYPELEEEDIRAAIAYGARASRLKRIAPLAAA